MNRLLWTALALPLSACLVTNPGFDDPLGSTGAGGDSDADTRADSQSTGAITSGAESTSSVDSESGDATSNGTGTTTDPTGPGSTSGVTDPGTTTDPSGTTDPTGTSTSTTGPIAPENMCPEVDTLVACYEFEQLDGEILIDGSSLGNDGFQKQLIAVPGYSGNAGQFSGMAKCGVLHNETLAPQEGFTVEAWIWPDSYPAEKSGIVTKQDQFALFLHPDGKLSCDLTGVGGATGGFAPLDEWTHVACTYDGQTLRKYINGSGGGGSNTLQPFPSSEHELLIGAAAEAVIPFEGRIDTVMLWKVALPEAELCKHAGTCP